MSPCRAHRQRVEAERQARAAGASPDAMPAGPLAVRMATLMEMHRVALKRLQSRTAKIAAKRDMLPDYAAYVDGVLASGAGGRDDVLSRVMLWRLDVADWDGALEIAAHALRHGLPMPEGFKRDVPATVLEEIADFALAQAAPLPELAAPLSAALKLTGECDMPDEVPAKAHKALGLILARAEGPDSLERALTHLETALRLDPRCGVKTELARIRKALDPGP